MIPARMVPGTHQSQLAEFRARCEEATGLRLDDPTALHAFAIQHPETFWRTFLDWTQLPWSGSADVVLTDHDVESARFFPDVHLNYAEALLRPLPNVDDAGPALTSVHSDRPTEHLSRAELRSEVAATAGVLGTLGVVAGDGVALIAPNSARTVVAALATLALGATVSTATPDMGPAALLGRFEQLGPTVLLIDRTGAAEGTAADLVAGLPTLQRVLLLDELPPLVTGRVPVDRLAELVAAGVPTEEAVHGAFPWERRPFDHPLFVMFSSGTTGPPKAMVHGAGGTLLEHVKEHRLHGDLRPEDTLYFHTTTAWMMWNWQLSALAVGAHVVVNDAPVLGPETLWRLVAEHGVTVFGTSPAYLQLCQDAGYRPGEDADLSRLCTIMSTGAVLHDWQYDWVADAVGPVPLQSISGGTDIIGCFVLGSPELPVHRGRCQTRSLGLDVAAVDEEGREVVGSIGELVCRSPFPTRPVRFLRDPDGTRFHAAYFADHPGMWTHGDLVEFGADGSARMHGRSDDVLNIDGVRIGPSEIYTVLRGVPAIADAMAVEQRDPARPGSTRMVLLVVLHPGTELDGELERTIRRTLRREATAAHVPSLVVPVPDLPLTHNGKRSERAARDAVNGDPVANIDALRNPDCLDAITRAVPAALPTLTTTSPTEGVADAVIDEHVLRETGRLWSEVLGLREPQPDDDFSDVGGTSRQLMSLLRRVRQELGADVSVQRFAVDPTPGGLARAIVVGRAAEDTAAPLLRPGVGRPLFLVGDAWGQVNLYAALVQGLITDRPVHGLPLRLLDDDGRRKTVTEIAADAVQRVQTLQPQGPYSLLGYSFGGLVAYEMAVALRTSGRKVAYLGLLDVLPPDVALTPVERTARRGATFLDSVRTGNLLTAAVQRLRNRIGRATPDPEWTVFWESMQIAHKHAPSHYAGAVTYYVAADRLPIVGNTLAAWRRVAPHLLVTEVPGRHWGRGDRRPGLLSEVCAPHLGARIGATLG